MNKKFIKLCSEGNLEEAKLLHLLGGAIFPDIHAYSEAAFRWSCGYGHMNVAKWLYSLGNVDIHAAADFAFLWSCRRNYTDIIQWLLSLDKFDNFIIDYNLPENLHEYAFDLGYLPIEKMKSTYEKYKIKIREQIKENKINGEISLFEIDGLVDIIMYYL